jgi:hypothetical protein
VRRRHKRLSMRGVWCARTAHPGHSSALGLAAGAFVPYFTCPCPLLHSSRPSAYHSQSLGTSEMAATADQDLESKIQHNVDHTDVYDEKAGISAFKAGAIEAENAEHNMTVMEAVKAYPMASFWAFVMSCTIVSSP